MSEHHHQENDYTDSDIKLKPLVIFLVATLVIAAVSVVGVKVLFNSYAHQSEQVIADVEQQMIAARPTNAVVEGLAEAAVSMSIMKAETEARLNHYRRIEGSEYIQIPIDRAMERVIEKGLPVRKDLPKVDTSSEL